MWVKSERIHHGDHARGVAGTELAPQGGGTEKKDRNGGSIKSETGTEPVGHDRPVHTFRQSQIR